MRIHSSTLDSLEVRKAARVAGVHFTRFGLHGSRTRDAAFDVILTGSSSRQQNGGPDKAATWDEWGVFLSTLYAIDPEMVTPYYANVEHFHWATNGRFRNVTARDFIPGHNHRWDFTGDSVTGVYSVHACKSPACEAVQRFTRDWDLVAN